MNDKVFKPGDTVRLNPESKLQRAGIPSSARFIVVECRKSVIPNAGYVVRVKDANPADGAAPVFPLLQFFEVWHFYLVEPAPDVLRYVSDVKLDDTGKLVVTYGELPGSILAQ